MNNIKTIETLTNKEGHGVRYTFYKEGADTVFVSVITKDGRWIVNHSCTNQEAQADISGYIEDGYEWMSERGTNEYSVANKILGKAGRTVYQAIGQISYNPIKTWKTRKGAEAGLQKMIREMPSVAAELLEVVEL